jgi:hypothetical protein
MVRNPLQEFEDQRYHNQKLWKEISITETLQLEEFIQDERRIMQSDRFFRDEISTNLHKDIEKVEDDIDLPSILGADGLADDNILEILPNEVFQSEIDNFRTTVEQGDGWELDHIQSNLIKKLFPPKQGSRRDSKVAELEGEILPLRSKIAVDKYLFRILN